jgi:hypothetical protein
MFTVAQAIRAPQYRDAATHGQSSANQNRMHRKIFQGLVDSALANVFPLAQPSLFHVFTKQLNS